MGFVLRLREPGQAELRIRVNGEPTALDPGLDGYASIRRTWSPGDTVEMEFDLPVSVRRFLGDALGPSDFRKNASRVARASGLRRSRLG